MRHRPTLIRGLSPETVPGKLGFVAYGVLIAVGLAMFVAPHASSLPDGLEAVANKLGFGHRAAPSAVPAVMPGYQLPLIGSPTTATAVAAVLGTLLALLGAYLLARVLVPTFSAGTVTTSPGGSRGNGVIAGSNARPGNQDANVSA
jgi:hypothetical protein